MTRNLVTAVLAALILDLLATGYGAVAAGKEGHTLCTQDQGSVRNHQCVRAGRVLFGVPL